MPCFHECVLAHLGACGGEVVFVFEGASRIQHGVEGLEQRLCYSEEPGRPCGVFGGLDHARQHRQAEGYVGFVVELAAEGEALPAQ